jgi:hypothetical protein
MIRVAIAMGFVLLICLAMQNPFAACPLLHFRQTPTLQMAGTFDKRIPQPSDTSDVLDPGAMTPDTGNYPRYRIHAVRWAILLPLMGERQSQVSEGAGELKHGCPVWDDS